MLRLAQSALVTYVTAGYPKAEDTPQIMLAMEKGGSGGLGLPPLCILAPLRSLTAAPSPARHY